MPPSLSAGLAALAVGDVLSARAALGRALAVLDGSESQALGRAGELARELVQAAACAAGDCRRRSRSGT